MATFHSPRTAWLVGITVTLAGGAAFAFWHVASEPSPTAKSAGASSVAEPGTVGRSVAARIYEVQASRDAHARQLTGSVRPRYQTDIAFRVSGKILRRLVEVGDQVHAGQLLFELDSQDFQLQLKSAEANLQSQKAAVLQAIAEEKRLKELRRTNAVSASEYDKGLSDRDIAIGRQDSHQKQLELAQNQLAYCKLVADADGIVTSVSAEAGQVVALGTPVCAIAQLKELEAVIDVPENHWPTLREPATSATFWSLPGVKCAARLREISPAADPLTRTYRARFTLIEPPAEIKLGMTVTVAIDQHQQADLLDIPASSIIRVQDRPAVWRVDEAGGLTPVPVEIAQYSTESVRISKGLSVGDRIVSAGAHKLDASIRVHAWEIQK